MSLLEKKFRYYKAEQKSMSFGEGRIDQGHMMLFTGLHDRNDKPIFEYDYIRNHRDQTVELVTIPAIYFDNRIGHIPSNKIIPWLEVCGNKFEDQEPEYKA